MKVRPLLLISSFALVAGLGYWLAGTAVPETPATRKTPAAATAEPKRTVMIDEPAPRFRRSEREPGWRGDRDARAAGALEGQRTLVFKSQEDLSDFLLRSLGKVRILGRLDALNALRVGFDDPSDLADLLDGDEDQAFIFPVIAPYPPDGSVQDGAMALGNNVLEWLGIEGDNSGFGRGVRIAVLDTGVVAHPAFNTTIQAISLVDPPEPGVEINGHGTAVASMIVGNGSSTPGVAPAAEILSVRIADNEGESNSFLLAKGIIAAADAGAQLINVSMGSQGDSSLVRRAIEYARDAGALIIAAAGNNGIERITYPAANYGVIAVGSVDGLGNHLAFSNSGESVAMAAPGFGLNAAWPGGQAASVTGTSFSAPIIAGAIAAVMTETGGFLSPAQAYDRLNLYLNDGGAPGPDPLIGRGMPDLGRTLRGNAPGFVDAAVASQRILPPDPRHPFGQVEILVQNRGTEPLINTGVEVNAGGGQVLSNLTSLAPNEVRTVRVPLARPLAGAQEGVQVDARVRVSNNIQDAKPGNDRRVETHVAQAPQ
jgi:hypothetical protein